MATHNHQVRRFMMLNKKDDKPWLCFTAQQANSTIRLDKVGTPNIVSLEISRDGKVWTPYSWTDGTGDTITLTKVGDKIYWRSIITDDSGVFSIDSSNYYTYIMSGVIASSGNIQSLLKKDCNRLSVATGCYRLLFYRCGSLISAPNLPATTLANHCYNAMFYGCTSLTKAPSLPATTLTNSCYRLMFRSCTSLISAPDLSATRLQSYCYYSMFYDCVSLISAPDLLAVTLANSCYRLMFNNCTLINKIKTNHKLWSDSEDATLNWLQAVSNSGEFYCSDELDDSIRDDSHIPNGWTVIKQGYYHNGVLYRDEEFTTPSDISSTTAVYEDILTGYRYSSDGTSLTLINS